MPKLNGNINILYYGLAHLAAEFTPEEEAFVMNMLPPVASDNFKAMPAPELCELPRLGGMHIKNAAAADVFVCGKTSSTFDLAWHLHAQNRLPEWGAVLALSQNSGRGQMRREWFSPSGNMYVSFRLPNSDFFAGSEATVLLGYMFIKAFEEMGLKLLLKWPNDLVLQTENGAGKLGGILLEERGGALVAGVGINCLHVPQKNMLREKAVLQAAKLPDNFEFLSPARLWLELVRRLIMIYGRLSLATPRPQILHMAEEYLLWRGREVQIFEDSQSTPLTGVVSGLSGHGGLMLLVKSNNGALTEHEIFSGSIVADF
ncbi:biotin--[acetyl-CoA-carboxylase] ligase [Desulfovibrio sp. OttesenSCG-928-F07]|nr:biotin--[acetyl-CoA-carboxylase] ligase [Desulfovibrio sp. OttesenSCG-928-F07]